MPECEARVQLDGLREVRHRRPGPSAAGRIAEAEQALAHTLMLQPNLSVDHVEKNTVFANPSDRSRFLLGLRKAGLQR